MTVTADAFNNVFIHQLSLFNSWSIHGTLKAPAPVFDEGAPGNLNLCFVNSFIHIDMTYTRSACLLISRPLRSTSSEDRRLASTLPPYIAVPRVDGFEEACIAKSLVFEWQG